MLVVAFRWRGPGRRRAAWHPLRDAKGARRPDASGGRRDDRRAAPPAGRPLPRPGRRVLARSVPLAVIAAAGLVAAASGRVLAPAPAPLKLPAALAQPLPASGTAFGGTSALMELPGGPGPVAPVPWIPIPRPAIPRPPSPRLPSPRTASPRPAAPAGLPIPPLSAAVRAELEAAARETGLPAALLQAVATVESQGNPWAVSPAGAEGLMQLEPVTAASLGVRNVFDPSQNARGGARYLAGLLLTYAGGDSRCVVLPSTCPAALRLALAAYNAGPGTVRRYGGVPPYPETQRYVRLVTSLYQRITSATATP